ncbi:MAG: DUF6531 domain-containing protein, partial [Clostridiales bacterium]|nr:DUF6531 domain-containing protein [Clostridiales bacterium]
MLSGNLSRSYSDLSFDAPGFTLNVSRAYNSIDTRDSFISKGWTFGFSSDLKKEGNDTVIRMPDGSVRTFMVESNGTYTAKDSRAKLTKSGEEHILTTPDHYQYRYNDKGYMYRMTDPNSNQINLTVDDKGKVTQVADAVGRTLTVAYDTSNRISTITESTTGRVVRYFYDSNGCLSEASTPDGSAIVYIYNSDGLLYQVRNNNYVVLEQFTYETQDGEQKNERKRIKTAKLPSGITETYAYDIYEGSITTTTGSGTSARTTTTYFDRALYPILITDAEGGQQRFEYNLDGGINRYGEIKTSTDRNGNTSRYEYDTRGNVTKTIYPDLSSKLFTYDSKDNLTAETDELGYKTFYTYDSYNNLLKRIKPLDGLSDYSASADQNLYAIESYTYYTAAEAKTMCGYSIGGLLKTSMDAAGNIITYTYDARGNLATSTDSLNRKTTYSFNILGWLKQQTSPMGYTTKYYYDKCGRLLKKIMQGGESERYVYDLLGNLTQSISPRQFVDTSTYTAENIVNAAAAPANTLGHRYTYTPAGLVETAKDPLNNTTTYTYDTYGNKTKETLPSGLAYTYTYDKLNRPTNKSYLDGSTTIKLEDYSYPLQMDGTTKQTNRVYFSGTTDYADTTYTYDFANRLLQTANPDGGVISNTYLANGLAESTTDAMGNTTYFEYDPMNRMTKRWAPHDDSRHSLAEWQYDNANRVIEEKNYSEALGKGASPGWEYSTLDYTYNIDSTVKDIITNGMGKTEYFYNDDGQIYRETKLQDGTRSQRTDYAYNYWGKIASSTTYVENKDIDGNPDDSTLFGLTTSYTYDKNSNLEKITYPNDEIVSYEYDLLNRQTGEKRSVLNEYSLKIDVTNATTYDNIGNVTSRQDEKGNIANYVYNPRGFLLRVTDAQNAVTAREYDLQGRLTREYSPRA